MTKNKNIIFFLGRRSVVSRRLHRPNMTTEQLACGRTALRADPHKHRPDVDRACQIRQASTEFIDAAHSGVAPQPLRGILRAVDRSEKNRRNSIWLQPPLPPRGCPRNLKTINRVAHRIIARSKCLGRELRAPVRRGILLLGMTTRRLLESSGTTARRL